MAFPEKEYFSLEAPDNREFVKRDPRGFLSQYRSGVIIDEVQRAPDVLSYIQGEVDEDPSPGRYILTGSANFSLMQSLSQSLAGRTAVANLFPLSLDELNLFENAPGDLFSTLCCGGYPAIFDRNLPPNEWYGSYVGTYVERDVRQILNVTDLTTFQTFLRLCAGRTGQLLNLSQLGADCGITHNTSRAWLSVLETGYVLFRLPPFHSSFKKRLVKTPKLHFYDAGLLCFLLGIRSPDQLINHPMRGAIFESWVVSEIVKARAHHGLPMDLFHFRDRKGFEIDVVFARNQELVAVEIKSGQTIASDFFASLDRFEQIACSDPNQSHVEKVLIYGGDVAQQRTQSRVIPWSDVPGYDWTGIKSE
jgi:predicted AAA+ superfamily ATPase